VRVFFYIYIIVSIAYMVIGLISIMHNRREHINRTFFSICLNLSFWAFMHGIIQFTDSAEIVSQYRRIMIFSWSALYAQILYFSIFLTNSYHLYKGIRHNVLIMIFPIFNFLFYVTQPTTIADLQDTPLGWLFLHPQNRGFLWDQLFNMYYLIYMTISIGLILRWRFKSNSKREIKQANIIITGFASVLVLGSITDVVLPIMGVMFVPPLSVVLILGVIAAMCYAIIKYKLMNITPESIMMDVFMKMSEGIVITDDKDTIIGINSGTKKITGYLETDLVGKHLSYVLSLSDQPDELSGIEFVITDKFDNPVDILLSKIYQYDQFDKILGSVYTFQDITLIKNMQAQLEVAREKLEEKVYQRTKALSISNDKLKSEVKIRMEKEAEINRLIYNDYLTNLPNRRYLNLKLQNIINDANVNATGVGVLFLDLDNFKLINDTMGHDAGDALLIEVGARLTETLRDDDCICRVGGDEFVVLLENVKSRKSINRVCEKIIQMFGTEFLINDISVHVKGSIGVSVYPEDGTVIETILENADIAMYRVKESQKNGFLYYDPSMRVGMDEAMYLTNELYKAVEEKSFEVYYQPQINSLTHELTGFEALIRWIHPVRGVIMPNKFIHLAEKTGLIHPIGYWVIRNVFKQLTVWGPEFNESFTIGVNLSPNQLMTKEFPDSLERLLEEFDVPAHLIEFEVTEGIFINKLEIIESNLNRIKNMGFSISIDDFGTEYASMTYLKFMPLDRIKIPREFIEGIGVHRQDEAIVKSIITLSNQLECSVIAEGVETLEQVEYLQKHMCNDIQGYYYFKPIDTREAHMQFFSMEYDESRERVPIEHWAE